MNIIEFNNRFSTEKACLDDLFLRKYGKRNVCLSCRKPFRYYKVKNRKAYECGYCGRQVYPMASTIFEGSTTSIQKWYYAIYLFSVSKNGVSAKEIQRQLSVTYKTAWRIGHQVRKLLADDGRLLTRFVEIDESLYGKKSHSKGGWDNKSILFGMIERRGRVRVRIVPDRSRDTLTKEIKQSVKQGARVHTDKYKGYFGLWKHGYRHRKKDGKRIHINSMEGYWGNFKKAMFGTHTWVSPKHLQNYLDEFQFRHNNRNRTSMMFDLMLNRIVT